jgi:hypothetical protein
MFRLFKFAETTYLYHRSSWPALGAAAVGDAFVLHPGIQGAEGSGVYFSEGVPVVASTAEGVGRAGSESAIVRVEVGSPAGWWRTKAGLAKKFGRPRTWHSDGKSLRIVVRDVSSLDGVPLLTCDWSWV